MPIAHLTVEEISRIDPSLRNVIENRKSGLSLNHIIGCPLDCAYCVRHIFGNYQMKEPRALMSDELAVETLLKHPYFVPHSTPLQLLNRATDPFLPSVKPHTYRVLKLLDDAGFSNTVLIITRYHVSKTDTAVLNKLAHIKVALLFTWSGIEERSIEPIDSNIAAQSLMVAFHNAESYRAILYWRPIVPSLNDGDTFIRKAAELSKTAHATVFTGLFFRDEIRDFYVTRGLQMPYGDVERRKIFPKSLERTIISKFEGLGGKRYFRKTSCGVSYAFKVSDYNGHYGIRELCDICPPDQVTRCRKAWHPPSERSVALLALKVGCNDKPSITNRAILFPSMEEHKRYFIQHSLNYQVHDSKFPHHYGRHGRAENGWIDIDTPEV